MEGPSKHDPEILAVQELVERRYSNLTVQAHASSRMDEGSFLLITPRNHVDSELMFLPTFQVAVNLNGGGLSLFLLSFNAKVLREETLSLQNVPQSIPKSRLLDKLDSGSLRLCPGLTDGNNSGHLHLLRERVSERIVIRSEDCSYAIDNCESACVQCIEACRGQDEGKVKLNAFPDKNDFLADLRSREYFKHSKSSRSGSEDGDDLDLIYDDATGSSSIIEGNEKLGDTDTDLDVEATRSQWNAMTAVSSSRPRPRPQRECVANDSSDDEYVQHLEEGDQPRKKARRSLARSKEAQVCPKCGRQYLSRHPYEKHLQHCLDGDKGNLFSANCVLCLRHFSHELQLNRHMEFHRSKHEGLDKVVSCPVCNLQLITKYELNPHFQKNHDHSKGCCIECLGIFEAKSLRRHLFNKHFYSVKNKLCPTCGESFSTPLQLRVHVSSAHDSSSTSVVCDQCGKVFPHKIKLNHHVYHRHNTTRMYPCHSCDKVFMNPMSFYKHVKIHSVVKPFSCDICGYRAVRKDNVRQHVKKVERSFIR